jgi:hypothetical protein
MRGHLVLFPCTGVLVPHRAGPCIASGCFQRAPPAPDVRPTQRLDRLNGSADWTARPGPGRRPTGPALHASFDISIRRVLREEERCAFPEFQNAAAPRIPKERRPIGYGLRPTAPKIIVVELHDALTAWLTLNPAKAPNRDGVRQIQRQPGPTAHS